MLHICTIWLEGIDLCIQSYIVYAIEYCTLLYITYITCVTIVFYLRENQVNQDTQAEMASQDVLLVQDLSNCRCMSTISHTIGLPRNPWSEGKNLWP